MDDKLKKRLLLHVCCAPCGTHCIDELRNYKEDSGVGSIVMYFFNPNIHPTSEYFRRWQSAKKLSRLKGVKIIEEEYEPQEWIDFIQGFENEPEGGRRCKACFALRLNQAAKYAAEHGFDCVTTTMTISPHKDAELINSIGRKAADKYGGEWINSDFKKNDGFNKSAEISKDMNLYRQKYCGCFYSVR
ncbi:epoxyqueuosine reductase QueH [Candidatus Woesearchaeota archaeon]|nr:epoxyqueuosine reductase QueH [Candidatus Woesearchaeota archaeon]